MFCISVKMNKAAAEKRAKIDEDHKKRIAEHALRSKYFIIIIFLVTYCLIFILVKAAKEQAAQNKEAKKKGYVNVPF